MAKCPHCDDSFAEPTITPLKRATSGWGLMKAYMATCPKCDVVLRIFSA